MLYDQACLNRLYRYAYALTAETSAAYDLLQDTMERCLRRQGQAPDHPEAFAKRVMRNRYIDLKRQVDRAPAEDPIEDHADTLAIDVHCLQELAINQDELSRIWRQLDDVEREILYLWAVEGLTTEEIAISLNSKRGSVLSRIHRLRLRIKKSLDLDHPAGCGGPS